MTRASLFCLAILCSCARARAPVREDAIAFVDVNVVPLDRDGVLPAQTVIVRGTTIVAMGPTATTAIPAGAREIRAHGQYLLPALTDMHAHLGRASDLSLYVAAGVTTVRNMWGAPMHLDWRARIAKGELLGPTIVTAGPIVDGESPVHDGSLVVRTPEDADRAIALHQKLGYDFVKVYNGVPANVFERLAVAAHKAHLPVVGHVPRAVGFERALDLGMHSIEHMSAFPEALQANDSPVAGKFDGASRRKKLDHVDDAKLPLLVKHVRDTGTWLCPTRAVMADDEPPSVMNALLARPANRYMGGYELVLWRSDIERPPETIAAESRYVALGDRVIKALHDGKANVLVGTDPGNPFIIPGFSVHEELALLQRDGFTPYEVLRAATRGAAEFLGADDFGVVAIGKRADLLLLNANPLADIHATEAIDSVMVRGRLLGPNERAALLAQVQAAVNVDPLPPLTGDAVFAAKFRIEWRGAAFGAEHVLVEKNGTIRAQTFDPHDGQTTSFELGDGWKMQSDGARGRGNVVVSRDANGAHAKGTVLAGVEATADAKLDPGDVLVPSGFLASYLAMRATFTKLAVGATTEVRQAEVSIGSTLDIATHVRTVRRVSTTTYEITEGKEPTTLVLDENGFPVECTIPAHGDKVHFVLESGRE